MEEMLVRKIQGSYLVWMEWIDDKQPGIKLEWNEDWDMTI